MECKLCLKTKPLLRKSHIIPDFMYNGLFDDKHFLYAVQFGNEKRAQKIPTGYYDQRILCQSCDNEIIGGYETYASKVIYGGDKLSEGEAPRFENCRGQDGLRSILIHDVSYKKFKLFLLSVLWRSHISTHKFFRKVDLGTRAEQIRQMLLNGDPGPETEFETCLVYLDSKNKIIKSIIDPRPITDDLKSGFVFHINHTMYHFNLNQTELLPIFESGMITTDNKMEIAILESELADSYFKAYLGN